MRLLAPLLALMLVGAPAATGAADFVVTLDGERFSPATVTLKRGDRLVIVNPSPENHFVWAHSGGYAFDFRATDSNVMTHKPGDRLGIVMHIPGTYRLGCALHEGMHAVVIVEE
jgi:plastocyanin